METDNDDRNVALSWTVLEITHLLSNSKCIIFSLTFVEPWKARFVKNTKIFLV